MRLVNTEFTNHNTMLNNIAHQNPDTSNPGRMEAASRITNALITRRKSPKVKKVTGIVRIISNGFRVTLNKASKAARSTALKKFSTLTPGKR